MKGLLFDLDGVIVDTAKYHFIAWEELAKELGIVFTEEDNERLKGVSRLTSFEIILEIGRNQNINLNLTEHEKNSYCKKKNIRYVEYISKMKKTEILPGVEEFIQDARSKGYKIALGSASKNARLILNRIEMLEYFDEIIDGTKITDAKPNPEVFLAGAKALCVEPSQCFVFEDAVAGIEAAHRGGMKAIGVGTRESLPEADLIIKDFLAITISDLEERLENSFM